MKLFRTILVLCLVLGSVYTAAAAVDEISLPSEPALSPDGARLAFSWRGDIWTVPAIGGEARQLTDHAARDDQPCFSPDGRQIAFITERFGGWQVVLMPSDGGPLRRLTHHSEGYRLHAWTPDGAALLVSGMRDHFWCDARRFFLLPRDGIEPRRPIFDAGGNSGALAPDGRSLLFTREGVASWRKGYRGSAASQIWHHDLKTKEFTKLLDHEGGCRSPLWRPDGGGFYFVAAMSGSFNLWSYDLATGEQTQLTFFDDDSVVNPCISLDGSAVVFAHLFDFYLFYPGSNQKPRKIDLWTDADVATAPTEKQVLEKADHAAFTADGLEVAFIAGGDLFVMDTELREPRRVTATPGEERDAVFSPEGDEILYVSASEGRADIWRAVRGDAEKYWWDNETFSLERITNTNEIESGLTICPDGSMIAFLTGRGDLWLAKRDGSEPRKLLSSWNSPDYDWSPDGRWIVCAMSDENFNRDIWLVRTDGSSPPYNVSRHPDNEFSPVWSPDGKAIAFTGRRYDTEIDIFYVWLARKEADLSKRDRSRQKALEKMDKVRKKKKKKKDEDESKDDGKTKDPVNERKHEPAAKDPRPAAPAGEPVADTTAKELPKPAKEEDQEKKKIPEVVIDFENIHERVRRISIPDAFERGLFWSHDSKKLAFSATIKGKRGTYTLEFPDKLEPTLLSDKTGGHARWIEEGNQIVWLADGKPGSLSSSGKAKSYAFETRVEVDRRAHQREGFLMAWRAMGDSYYDRRLNNRDWNVIRDKYVDQAAAARDPQTFADVISLMLGELNGSHLGFYSAKRHWSSPEPWKHATAHLGVRFDPDHAGPGLAVRDVIPDGPADLARSRIEPGEIIKAIDGIDVSPQADLLPLLNGVLERDIRLTVLDAQSQERTVVLRPISFSRARYLLRKQWIRECRLAVAEGSGGRLGYLYIPGMNWSSFQEFEREIYAQGAGKAGLVIDVRNNGGGFTADHLLTVLCQPAHAITIQRGGHPGYPQDRRVYAAWDKPIVVLCNQGSFSNAEIFSHAIKNLERGQLVGVPTAGGVISTGSRRIMDLGRMRMPFRGWFTINDGRDMELNGAVPHHIIWPKPGELPSGVDVQLNKAVQVLLEDVDKAAKPPSPIYRPI